MTHVTETLQKLSDGEGGNSALRASPLRGHPGGRYPRSVAVAADRCRLTAIEVTIGGEGGIRTHVPELPDHPISSRRRCDHFGTSPVNLKLSALT